MNYYARLGSLGLVAVVFLAGLAHALGWWSRDEENLLQQVRRLLFEARRTEALIQRNEAVVESFALKRTILAEILAGRLTLHEAAERFTEANNHIDRDDPELVAEYLKPTTQEGVYQQVLSWVEYETGALSPEQAKKILTPLENEYQERFGTSPRGPGPWQIGRDESDSLCDESRDCEALE